VFAVLLWLFVFVNKPLIGLQRRTSPLVVPVIIFHLLVFLVFFVVGNKSETPRYRHNALLECKSFLVLSLSFSFFYGLVSQRKQIYIFISGKRKDTKHSRLPLNRIKNVYKAEIQRLIQS
jgi:hypothetical protein